MRLQQSELVKSNPPKLLCLCATVPPPELCRETLPGETKSVILRDQHLLLLTWRAEGSFASAELKNAFLHRTGTTEITYIDIKLGSDLLTANTESRNDYSDR